MFTIPVQEGAFRDFLTAVTLPPGDRSVLLPPDQIAHGGRLPPEYWWHIGLYAYRVGSLRQMSATPPSPLEQAEKLEQLRALSLGMEIRIAPAVAEPGPDINTPDDLRAAEAFIAGKQSA